MEDGQDPVGERNLNFFAHSARLLRKLLSHVFGDHSDEVITFVCGAIDAKYH